MTITSAVAPRRENTKVDDSYIQVAGKHFGQVVDIMWLPGSTRAMILLQKFEKIPLVHPCGDEEIVFPINQFPVSRTNLMRAFHVVDELFIQKIVVQKFRFKQNPNEWHDLFAIRANEWFRF